MAFEKNNPHALAPLSHRAGKIVNSKLCVPDIMCRLEAETRVERMHKGTRARYLLVVHRSCKSLHSEEND